MNIQSQLKKLLKEKELKLTELHARLTKAFGEKAITYRSLQRIFAGHTEANKSSLYQICIGLGVTLKDLRRADVESEAKVICARKNDPQGFYFFNPDANAEILTGPQASLCALRLTLKPQAQTKPENDPQGSAKFVKWVYVQSGELICSIEGKRYDLKKGDSIYFDSRLTHAFENHSSKTSHCLIIQNPRHI